MSLPSKAGSDAGGNPSNDAGLRLDFEVTVGLRVLELPPKHVRKHGHWGSETYEKWLYAEAAIQN